MFSAFATASVGSIRLCSTRMVDGSSPRLRISSLKPIR